MKSNKGYIILTILLSIVICGHSQKKTIQTTPLNIHVDSLKIKTVSDTLKVQVSSKNEQTQSDKAWQVALTVGILSFLGIIVASFVNRSGILKSVEKQTSASITVATNQINSTKELAIGQITNSQNLALHEFNATLKTKNRQEWINELRNSMSEFITHCSLINIEFQDPTADSPKVIKGLHEKISLSRTKMLLLLHPKNKDHDTLLKSLHDFVNILDEHILNYRHNIQDYKNLDFKRASDKVVNDARELLYGEWKEIKDLEKTTKL